MKMKLPENFNGNYGRIVNNRLITNMNSGSRWPQYEKAMYEVTYAYKKQNRCIYCGKVLEDNDKTLDHVYPRATGGISIVDNLNPCCKECNADKGSMTHEEYLAYLTLSPEGKEAYRETLVERRKMILEVTGFNLPSEWVMWEKLSRITCKRPRNYTHGKSYENIAYAYKKYGNITKPLVVDRNFKLLDGYNTYMFAKDYLIRFVPVVWLENVYA